MNCKEFRQLLDLYVDGELSPEASFSALEHMEACVRCKRAQHQLLRLRRALKRVVKQPGPPPGLVKKVERIAKSPWYRLPGFLEPRQAITSREGRISFWHRKISIPMPVFTLLLSTVLIGGIWILSTRTFRPPATTHTVFRKDDSAMSTDPGAFDLAQFDRGERAAIYKVRQSEVQNRQR